VVVRMEARDCGRFGRRGWGGSGERMGLVGHCAGSGERERARSELICVAINCSTVVEEDLAELTPGL
jgi:hypothetical protein